MRAARWLGWLIPRAEREFVLGDLQETFGRSGTLRFALELIRAALACHLASTRTLRLASPLPRVSSAMTDFRYALRQLKRSPGFVFLAVLTLALGIGGTTAIYSVISPVLFEPLPYPHPERIVTLWDKDREGHEINTGYATFVDLAKAATSFEAIAVSGQWLPTLQGRGEPERLDGQRVTQGYFSVLGVRPALGRDFSASEQIRGSHRVTILSHGLWRRRFGADSSIIGKQVSFDGFDYTIVGVMPASFESLHSPTAQLWAPLGYDASLPWACRTCRHLRALGRLKPGVSVAMARREVDLISARLVAAYPRDYSATGMFVIPLQTGLTRQLRPMLLAVFGAVVLVLLISCANVSALLLGRAMRRESEFAIRDALGAGRGRILRQLLTESVLLGLLGGAAGVLLAWAGVKGLLALGPDNLPRLQAIRINGLVLGFTAAISVASGLLFGLLPAFAALRPNRFSSLRPGGRLTATHSKRFARAVLVTGEIAMAVMLLAGAGLLLRSLEKLVSVNPGFEPDGLLTLEVQTTGTRYTENAPVWAFFERALAEVRAVPGVASAGWTSQLPLGGNFDQWGIQIEGKLLANPELAPSADRYAVSPGYLESMRIPLRRGRSLAASDDANAPPVVLINETFARLSWPGEDPLGKRVQLGGPDRPWRTIVGITGDVHHTGLDEQQAPQLYLPEVQGHFADNAMALVVRTRGTTDPATLARPVQAAIHSIDPSLPILRVAAMDEVITATLRGRRFALVVFQVFAGMAVLLAALGMYGVLASNVTERTREIGIRAALGASRAGLLGLVIRQAIGLSVAGIILGAAGALGLSRFLRKLLFGITPADPVTFAGVVIVLGFTALLACWIPARRTTRVSPLEALRSE